jgi:hypothetical protein
MDRVGHWTQHGVASGMKIDVCHDHASWTCPVHARRVREACHRLRLAGAGGPSGHVAGSLAKKAPILSIHGGLFRRLGDQEKS